MHVYICRRQASALRQHPAECLVQAALHEQARLGAGAAQFEASMASENGPKRGVSREKPRISRSFRPIFRLSKPFEGVSTKGRADNITAVTVQFDRE